MLDKDFQEFRKTVLTDLELMRDLLDIDDHAQFKEVVVTKAATIGLDLTVEDVEAAMRNGRRSWIERWI